MPTNVELKATLRRYGLPVSGSKEVLTRRLIEARVAESLKRVERAFLVKGHPALRLGVPRSPAQQAVIRRLVEETEAALRASGVQKRLQKNPALRAIARRIFADGR